MVGVARKIEHDGILQAGDTEVFQLFDRKIQECPIVPFVTVSRMLHFVHFVVRQGRIVHQHNVVELQVSGDETFPKRQGGIGLPPPRECLRRSAQCLGQQMIDFFQPCFLDGLNPVCRRAPQFHPVLAQERQDQAHHPGVVRAAETLRHDLLRHDAIFRKHKGGIDEVAAVSDRFFKQVVVPAGRQRLPTVFDYVFHPTVALLQDVVELPVRLRKFKIIQALIEDHVAPEQIQGREQPAASGPHLVRDAPGRNPEGTTRIQRGGRRGVQENVIKISVQESAVFGLQGFLRAERFQQRSRKDSFFRAGVSDTSGPSEGKQQE